MTPAENGSFVSVQISALLACRVLSSEEIETLSVDFTQRSASIGLVSEIEYRVEEFAPALRNIRSSHPEIAKWIDFQNQTIALLAAQFEHHRASLSGTLPQTITISATGMECLSHVDCNAGDQLEIILSLGQSMPTILIVGQVDKVMESESTEGSQNIKVDFNRIRESDQEMLMRHIHRVQLDQIRSARASRQQAITTDSV